MAPTLAGMIARISTPQRSVRPAPAPPRIRFLHAWRKHRKISQEKLGAAIGKTQGFISQLETGSTDYTGSHLEGLAAALDCTPVDLLRHDPRTGESPYTLLERLDASERTRVINILKAALDKG